MGREIVKAEKPTATDLTSSRIVKAILSSLVGVTWGDSLPTCIYVGIFRIPVGWYVEVAKRHLLPTVFIMRYPLYSSTSCWFDGVHQPFYYQVYGVYC